MLSKGQLQSMSGIGQSNSRSCGGQSNQVCFSGNSLIKCRMKETALELDVEDNTTTEFKIEPCI